MGVLIPTPVTLENLIDETSAVNVINPAAAQAASPRKTGTDVVTVQVKDDPLAPIFASGVADTNTANHAIDATFDFEALGVVAGFTVIATASGLSANVLSVTGSDITMDADILPLGTEAFTVIAPSYWTQRLTGGEWKRSGTRTGNDSSIAYTLPVNTASTVVHGIVYPIALANIATYPPITSAE